MLAYLAVPASGIIAEIIEANAVCISTGTGGYTVATRIAQIYLAHGLFAVALAELRASVVVQPTLVKPAICLSVALVITRVLTKRYRRYEKRES